MKYLYEATESPLVDFESSIPTLVRRLDRRAIEAVATRVQSVAVDSPNIRAGYVEFEEQAELWGQVLSVLEEEVDRLADLQAIFGDFANRYLSESTEEGRRAQIETYIEMLRSHPLATSREKRGRHALTDFETMQYRHQRLESRVEARIRVCCLSLARIATDIVERTGDVSVASYFIGIRRVEVRDELVQRSVFSHIRWLALEAVAPFLRVVIGEEPEQFPVSWVRLLAAINASNHNSWLEISALGVLGYDRDDGLQILVDRLVPRDYPDDWHTRSHCVKLLFERDADRAMEVVVDRALDEERDGVLIAMIEHATGSLTPLFEVLARKRDEAFDRMRGNLVVAAVEGVEHEPELAPFLLRLFAAEESSRVLEVIRDRVPPIVGEFVDFDELVAATKIKLENASPKVANECVRILVRIGEKHADLEKVATLTPGRSVEVDAPIEALRWSLVQHADQGFGLYAKKTKSGWRVTRGETFRAKPWRLLHEMRRPAPDKRQGYDHLRGRVYAGHLRAHPFELAEVTPTTVPGERKQIRREDSSGYYLPTVDDVLDAQFSRRTIEVLSPHSSVLVVPPKSRWRRVGNYFRMSWNYRELDQQRFASLSGDDATQRARYAAELHNRFGTELVVRSHEDWDVPSHVSETMPTLAESRLSVLALTWGALSDRLSKTVQLGDLAIVLVLTFVLFFARLMFAKHRIERWRRQIPLSVGGWGTRGKSGTERLKAGMFHGLGYDVFVKTTGCEAMFIHAPRNIKAREIFIYRPYDKATIWEQRDLLQMGAALESDVFLWECMALNPRYVNLLQSHWMRDDIVTLTNAYPDHEDIQGPAGVDVAETISQFIPRGARVLTTEREMYPIFEREAARKKASLYRVPAIAEHLLSYDTLARFPYEEHPRNIALVTRLAVELGVEPEFATFNQADNVVPDLGVLKVYPQVNVWGRRLSFVNGCSANERAGFMANWTRLKMDEMNLMEQPEKRVFTVVNNRGDRIARSKVFADILANDIAVDGHFLIGTNLSGLRNYLSDSIEVFLDNYVIVERGEEFEVAEKRLLDLLARVRMHPADEEWLEKQLNAMGRSVGAPFPLMVGEVESIMSDVTVSTYEETLAAVRNHAIVARLAMEYSEVSIAHDEYTPALEPFERATVDDVIFHWTKSLTDMLIASTLVDALRDVCENDGDPTAFSKRTKSLWRERFFTTVYSIENAKATGDQIIFEIARNSPPGFEIKLMGTQNIKGTGLDFVYRWVYLQETIYALEQLESLSDAQIRDAFVSFTMYESQGFMEVLEALRALQRYTSNHTISPANKQFLDAGVAHLQALLAKRATTAQSISHSAEKSRRDRFYTEAERWLDPFDAVYRRIKADSLKRRFAAQQVSHARMADEMQRLTYRQKGGWLSK